MIWFVWTRLAVVFLAKAISHLISNGSDLRLVDKSSPFPGIPCSKAELTPAAIFLVAITLAASYVVLFADFGTQEHCFTSVSFSLTTMTYFHCESN
ncbi:hypothetical protein BC936DRAFT_139917 [Jimgerdemannia flammicorona]|uniref:Uncharacterized protein n=1 Tax=Jimgerdemannia flammicorona TaxID=994334 RepID=A0A433B939_9FUNG|nr:hypothetical protein BC936DRAFT_139917 [Jimgerdemannia flammicorona]